MTPKGTTHPGIPPRGARTHKRRSQMLFAEAPPIFLSLSLCPTQASCARQRATSISITSASCLEHSTKNLAQHSVQIFTFKHSSGAALKEEKKCGEDAALEVSWSSTSPPPRLWLV